MQPQIGNALTFRMQGWSSHRRHAFPGFSKPAKPLFYCSFTPKFHFNLRAQSRTYYTSITDFQVNPRLRDGEINPTIHKMVSDLIAKSTIKANLFMSADLGAFTGDIVSRQLLDVMKACDISMGNVTQIVCADKATNVQYRQSVLRLMDDFRFRQVLVVGGSSYEGRQLDPSAIRESAKSLTKSINARGIEVAAVANTNLPFELFLQDIELKRALGIKTFYTQLYFGWLDPKIQIYLEKALRSQELDITLGVIYATQRLYDERRMTTDQDQPMSKVRQFVKKSGALDQYPMRPLTKQEQALPEGERWKEYNNTNVAGAMDWLNPFPSPETKFFTRVRRENEYVFNLLGGTRYDLAYSKPPPRVIKT